MKYTLLLLLFFQSASGHLNVKNGVALSGYDPISYFEPSGPLEGQRRFSHNWGGGTYYFTSDEHRQQFQVDPKKYLPKYGGWCAYAMGVSGEKVKVDPETFKIWNGELYLFYNFWGNNTLKSWNQDEEQLRPQADKYWSEIIAPK